MTNSTFGPVLSDAQPEGNDTGDGPPKTWQATGSHVIYVYGFPVVLVLSWVNNAIAIVVLSSKAYRRTSTGFLMIALAVADVGVVSTGLLRIWLRETFRYDLRLTSDLACRLHAFLTYVSVSVSAWSLTLISVERAISVCNPLRCRRIATRRRIVVAWSSTFAVIAAAYGVIPAAYSLRPDAEGPRMRCAPSARYLYFWDAGYFAIIDLVVSSLGPFAVILPCNLVIVVQILRSRARRGAMGGSQAPGGVSSTTVMLTATSVLFLVLTAPMAILILILNYGVTRSRDDVGFAYAFSYLLFNLNSAVNFLLYCASGTKFRRTLAAVCSRSKSSSRAAARGRTVRGSNTSTTDANGTKLAPGRNGPRSERPCVVGHESAMKSGVDRGEPTDVGDVHLE